jgi:poly-gamma-glutamate synthesis protein (capsule biosynthesis protein)
MKRWLLLLLGLLGGCERQRRTELSFVGDVLLDSKPGAAIRAGKDPFAGVAAALAKSDLSIANLESCVAESGHAVGKVYTFRAEPRVLSVLKRHVDLVSLANNHSGDFGSGALLETMSHLRRAGIGYFGAGADLRSAHEPLLVESHGIVLALLGYDEYKPRSFEAGPSSPGVAWSEDEQVVSDILRARQRHADVVVPFMHWGWERESAPSERQRALARKLIDAGADAVVGSHPHRTQGVEYYHGKLIVYSLGNFVFDLVDSEHEQLGWLLRLELDPSGVRRWSTLSVRLDADGAPTPDPSALTPCGKRGRDRILQCKNGELP